MNDNRSYLADLRTVMANERTLLAYYRSAVAIVALSAFVIKFYQQWFVQAVAGLIMLVGFVIAYYGTKRYRKQRNKIIERR